MAEALKEILNQKTITQLADELAAVYDKLPKGDFIRDCCRGLEPLALLARAEHIAKAMKRHLPPDAGEALAVLTKSLGDELPNSSQFGFAVLRYMPHASFIALVGLPHFEVAMKAQEALTKRFSSEFCIRPFIVNHPKETHAQMLSWARSENVHVRRLASEGCRPRLPWAARLQAYQRDPSSVIEILELLKDDPEEYVRRSVANNLNDIAKDHPAKAIALCQRWNQDATPTRRQLIQHALRTLIKQGDKSALAIIGTAEAPQISISKISIEPKRPRIGQKAKLSFTVESTSSNEQKLMIDYVVHFQKANGQAKPKVFKLKQTSLAAGVSIECNATVSFQEMTTRKHYPGVHKFEAKINGVLFPLGVITIH